VVGCFVGNNFNATVTSRRVWMGGSATRTWILVRAKNGSRRRPSTNGFAEANKFNTPKRSIHGSHAAHD
jgi:hypothetical protein